MRASRAMGERGDKKLRGDRCRCATCGEYFNSTFAFDRHRVGGYQTATKPSTRRCLTVAEMAAKGMSVNPAGFWVTETRAQRAQRSLGVERSGGDLSGPVPSSTPTQSPLQVPPSQGRNAEKVA